MSQPNPSTEILEAALRITRKIGTPGEDGFDLNNAKAVESLISSFNNLHQVRFSPNFVAAVEHMKAGIDAGESVPPLPEDLKPVETPSNSAEELMNAETPAAGPEGTKKRGRKASAKAAPAPQEPETPAEAPESVQDAPEPEEATPTPDESETAAEEAPEAQSDDLEAPEPVLRADVVKIYQDVRTKVSAAGGSLPDVQKVFMAAMKEATGFEHLAKVEDASLHLVRDAWAKLASSY